MSPETSGSDRPGPGAGLINAEKQAAFWIAVLLVAGGLIYALSGVMAPFIAGLAVAYFFDPVADRLEKAGFSRGLSAAIVIVTFLAVAVAVAMLLYPPLQSQIMGLLERIPDLIDSLRKLAAPMIERLSDKLASSETADLRGAANKYASGLLSWAAGMLQSLWSGGLAFFNVLSLMVITPLVAFYLLRDWDRMVTRFDDLLPRASAATIREQMAEIDSTIAAFVRGQASVCLVLGAWYGIALTLVGLDFGLLVGLGTGILSFIPYLGAGIGMIVGVAIALHQFPDLVPVVVVVIIFVVGQTAESYFLTPRLIGDRVGLHPVWIIFALLAGGALFGFTGVLLAVPVTAVIGVLVRYWISRYLNSPYYQSD